VSGIEEVMYKEKKSGLSMPEIADRLETLEKTTGELRVRTVLEEQVQRLAETKGDASVFTAQLNELSFALRRLVDEVRKDDRNAVDVAIRTIAGRQDESSVTLDKFTKDIDKNMQYIQVRLNEVMKEVSAPKLLKLLRDQTTATVETALRAQSDVLAKHGRGLQGAKQDISRLPDETSIKQLVGVCMESALSAKDREIRRLQQQVESMREQSILAMRREEAVELVTKRVDALLAAQFGETVTAHSSMITLENNSKKSKKSNANNLKVLLKSQTGNGSKGEDSKFDPVMSIEGKDTTFLSSSLPSLPSSRHSSASADEKSYLTPGLSSNSRAAPTHGPSRWRPVHRKKAHDHMKSRATVHVNNNSNNNSNNSVNNDSSSVTSAVEPSAWSAHQSVQAPEGYNYGNGREAALRPLGVMTTSSDLPSSPLQPMTVNAKNMAVSKVDRKQQGSSFSASASQFSQEESAPALSDGNT
jgi:hypothetical protein